MKLSIDGRLRKAVQVAFVSGFAAAATPLFAQEAPTPIAASEPVPAAPAPESLPVAALPVEAAPVAAKSEKSVKLERVEVTGSRIRRVDSESAAPVFTVSRQAIENSGAATLGELLQEMPSIAGAATNPQVNNGGGAGDSTISLRGLGTARTLLLLNGRRLITQDVNAIPVNIIERVEVLKDGASAIYGSDAIGGVVNFITRKKFDGGDVSYTYGISKRDDSDRNNASLTFGSTGEQGDLQVGINYNSQLKISAADRDFSAFPYGLTQGQTTFGDGATSRILTGRYVVSRATATGGSTTSPLNCGAANNQSPTSTNVILTRISTGSGEQAPALSDFRCFNVNVESYNFQAENVVSTPQERFAAFVTGSRNILDNLSVFTEALYQKTESNFQIAPIPFDGRAAVDNVVIDAANIYNPFGQDLTDSRLRLAALGNRVGSFRTDRMQLTAGLKGDFLEDRFAWDVHYTYGTEEQVNTNIGDVYRPPLNAALGPSFDTNPAAGIQSPVCGTPGTDAANPSMGATIIPGCVPVNFFDQPSAAQVAYLQSVALPALNNISRGDLAVFGANINGDLAQLPAGALALGIGYEFRKESLKFTPDFLTSTGDVTGGASSPLAGGFDVQDYYAELAVPVLSQLPGVKSLEVSLGARYSDYSTFGGTTNTKIGIEYRPYDDLLIRGTYATVFRAPTISNLFGGQSESADTIDDPCVGFTSADTDPNHQAACNGVAGDGTYTQTGYQTTALVGGNPNLDPEEGTTNTFGFVYSPSWYTPLSITLDHFDFHLKDTISAVGSSTRVNQCYDNGLFCDSFTRDPDATGGDGSILNVVDVTDNVGITDTSGLDLSIRFNFGKTRFGRIGYNLDTTYIYRYTNERLAGDPTSQVRNVGTFVDSSSGGDGNFPRYRAISNLNWSLDGFRASLSSRYIHSVTESPADGGDPELPGFVTTRKVEAVLYHDIQASYTYKPAKIEFAVGVDNVTDEVAPLIYSGFNGTTDVRTYDVVGRAYYSRIKIGF